MLLDFYSCLKPILFKIPPERAHTMTLQGLKLCHACGLLKSSPIYNPRTVMNLNFPNPIGLAAGLDKNGDYLESLATLGFGFIEIGTVTPRPQAGNPPPRLFRLIQQEALINRLGFNSKGADYVANRLSHTGYRGILGINIGKNRDTPNELAIQDYLDCFTKLAPFASYMTINISSPNTQGLRDLQQADSLSNLLRTMKAAQKTYHHHAQKYVPLVVKISPDLSEQELRDMVAVCCQEKIDGMIATNTTIERDQLTEKEQQQYGAGGLSGKPLFARSTAVLTMLHQFVGDRIPIIAVGGICDEATAYEKYAAGASLLQVYTGLIYRGPKLVRELAGI